MVVLHLLDIDLLIASTAQLVNRQYLTLALDCIRFRVAIPLLNKNNLIILSLKTKMKTPGVVTLPTTTKNMAPPKKSSSRRSKKSYNGVTLPTDSTERRRLRNKLSAEVYRKRKQDALKTAKEDVDQCDEEMDALNVQLNDVSYIYIYS